jgi:hypothetical protein
MDAAKGDKCRRNGLGTLGRREPRYQQELMQLRLKGEVKY